jgi:hypothetical protein
MCLWLSNSPSLIENIAAFSMLGKDWHDAQNDGHDACRRQLGLMIRCSSNGEGTTKALPHAEAIVHVLAQKRVSTNLRPFYVAKNALLLL